jgi:hypothetical protein
MRSGVVRMGEDTKAAAPQTGDIPAKGAFGLDTPAAYR